MLVHNYSKCAILMQDVNKGETGWEVQERSYYLFPSKFSCTSKNVLTIGPIFKI